MKKVLFVLCFMLMLTGCNARETFETVDDIPLQPVVAQMQKLELTLPEEAAVTTMENGEAGKIYLCDGYTLTVQTLDAGDVDRTLRQLTGFSKEKLMVMQTQTDDLKKLECVWTAAGEGGDQVGRALVLDDGNFHYAVTVMADAAMAGSLQTQWDAILDSAGLSTD